MSTAHGQHRLRPFFRDTIEQNKKNWSDMTLRGIGRGLPVTEILGLVGLQMQTDIQTAIMTWKPPNSPNTIRKPNNKSPIKHEEKAEQLTTKTYNAFIYDSIKSEVVEEMMV